MPLRITARRADLTTLDVPLLAVGLRKGATIAGPLAALDQSLGGTLERTLSRKDFRGARDETLHLAGGAQGPQRVLLVGLGDASDIGGAVRRAASTAARQARKMGVTSLAWYQAEQSAQSAEAAAV